MKIAVLLACHNRRKQTIRCLNALYKSFEKTCFFFEVYLVDDGSTDGTSKMVAAIFPAVHIINGDGSLYWNGGMSLAFEASMNIGFDYYLWLNDDTFLYAKTISKLVDVAESFQLREKKHAIVVGSTQEKRNGSVNHGGVNLNGGWWKASLVAPKSIPIPCQTFNGNCVLIPDTIVQKIGNLDSMFIHAMGDIDYGLRVTAAGLSIIVMPEFAGICKSNPIAGTYEDDTLPLGVRLAKVLHVKGRPFKPWLAFHRRHFGWFGLIYCSATYLKIVYTWLLSLIRTKLT